jgi:hypothetical protein
MLRARAAALHPSRDPAGPTARSRTPGSPVPQVVPSGAPAGRDEGPASSAPNTGRAGGHENESPMTSARASFELRVSQTQTNKIINRAKREGPYSAVFSEPSEVALAVINFKILHQATRQLSGLTLALRRSLLLARKG